MAMALRRARVRSVTISLDTLDRHRYAEITGRDFHPQVLDGIDAAIAAGFDQIKLNCVLMRAAMKSLIPLIEFPPARNLILRFIELMPVSTTAVLDENNFMSILHAKRAIESHFAI